VPSNSFAGAGDDRQMITRNRRSPTRFNALSSTSPARSRVAVAEAASAIVPIVARAQPPSEAVRPLGRHADQRLLDQETDTLDRSPMRLQHDTGEPTQPVIDPVALAGPLQLGVISLAYAD
jgi:hypothetical protein